MPNRLSEAEALTRLREHSDAIVVGVELRLPDWTVVQVRRVLDAWGRADAQARRRADVEAEAAGPRVAARVGADLRVLFALDPDDMRATPLEIIRTAVWEPTEVLRTAGVAEVVREPFVVRAYPKDVYDLVPHNLGDLGDPELGPLHLAWGLARAGVQRARADHVG